LNLFQVFFFVFHPAIHFTSNSIMMVSRQLAWEAQGLWEGGSASTARRGLWISEGPHSLSHRRFI